MATRRWAKRHRFGDRQRFLSQRGAQFSATLATDRVGIYVSHPDKIMAAAAWTRGEPGLPVPSRAGPERIH
jgi:hypothetical protein